MGVGGVNRVGSFRGASCVLRHPDCDLISFLHSFMLSTPFLHSFPPSLLRFVLNTEGKSLGFLSLSLSFFFFLVPTFLNE